MSNWLLDYFKTVFVAPDEWFVGLLGAAGWNPIMSGLLYLSVVLLGLGTLTQILMARVNPAAWGRAMLHIGLAVFCFYLAAVGSRGQLSLPLSTNPQQEYVLALSPMAQLVVGDNRNPGAFVSIARFNAAQLEPTFRQIREQMGYASEKYRNYYDSVRKINDRNLADQVRTAPLALGTLAAARDGYGPEDEITKQLGSEFSKRQEDYESWAVGKLAEVHQFMGSFNVTLQMFMLLPSVYLLQTLLFGAALHVAVLVFPLIAALMSFGRLGMVAFSSWLSLVVSSVVSLLFISPVMSFTLTLAVIKPLDAYMQNFVQLNEVFRLDSRSIFERVSQMWLYKDQLAGNEILYYATALFLLLASVALSFFIFRTIARIFAGLWISPGEANGASVAMLRMVRGLARMPRSVLPKGKS